MNCVAMSKCCLYVKIMSISDSMFNIFEILKTKIHVYCFEYVEARVAYL